MSEDFHGLNPDDFNVEQIAMQEMAKLMVNFFRAFMNEGLSAQEAAALTAAVVSQSMPFNSPPPMED